MKNNKQQILQNRNKIYVYLRRRDVVGGWHPLAVTADQLSEPSVKLLVRHPHGKRLSTDADNLLVGGSGIQERNIYIS